MQREFSIRNQCCPNENCLQYNKIGQVNIAIHSRKEGRLRCSYCKTTWVYRRNTFFYRLKTPPEKITRALAMFASGKTIRSISQHLKLSPKTLRRWKLQHDHKTHH